LNTNSLYSDLVSMVFWIASFKFFEQNQQELLIRISWDYNNNTPTYLHLVLKAYRIRKVFAGILPPLVQIEDLLGNGVRRLFNYQLSPTPQ
jgi:hypothetical protein